MALFNLLSVPKNRQDWEIWSFSNRDQIDLIRKAILKRYNTNLTQYLLYPLDFSTKDRTDIWLANNAQAHNDFNAVLNLQSSDLLNVDFKDETTLERWIYYNYKELNTASLILAI